MGKFIIVAMSGGVDSSVAAALLNPHTKNFSVGVDVMGVFMRLNSSESFRKSEKQAKKIAKILKIPFLVLDLRKEFKKRVIDYFIKELKLGRTPNPCVVCNKEIKFGILFQKLKELKIDFDFVATGHYAKKQKTTSQKPKVIYKLLISKDKEKDQSYFLGQLNQRQLKYLLFPLGNYTKLEVKKMAKDFGLDKLVRPESRDICFAKHLKFKKGKIIDTDGRIIGKHNGLWFYTIGQRKGIGIGADKQYYVLDKDIKKNLLIVTKNEKDLYKKELICEKLNWISGNPSKLPIKVKAKIRYRHTSALAMIKYKIQDTRYKIQFDKPQRAITSGQLVVFYKGQELLGSGVIKNTGQNSSAT